MNTQFTFGGNNEIEELAYIIGDQAHEFDLEAIAEKTLDRDERGNLIWVTEDHDEFWAVVMEHAYPGTFYDWEPVNEGREILRAEAKDGAILELWCDYRDQTVYPSILVRTANGHAYDTDNTQDWDGVERYIPRAMWPLEIFAGKRMDNKERKPQPAVVEAIEAFRNEWTLPEED